MICDNQLAKQTSRQDSTLLIIRSIFIIILSVIRNIRF